MTVVHSSPQAKNRKYTVMVTHLPALCGLASEVMDIISLFKNFK